MLDTRILSLRVFTNQNSVDIIVWRLVPRDGNAWPNVGEKVESSPKGQVEGNVALSDFPGILSIQVHEVIDNTHSV